MKIAETRMLIESETAYLCAMRADEQFCERLKRNIARYKNLDLKSETLFKINKDFHSLIAEGADNKVLKLMMSSVLELMNGNMWQWAKQ